MKTEHDRPRWPLRTASLIALELYCELFDSCTEIVVAGSIRRKKETVGDVEILYISKVHRRRSELDLFDEATVCKADEKILQLESQGVIERRLNSKGSTIYGEKNKLMRHVKSGIAVDLFATSEECWWNSLVCRTGPARSNMEISSRAIAKGWRWHAYGSGFSNVSSYFHTKSEEDVFKFVSIPYAAPSDR